MRLAGRDPADIVKKALSCGCSFVVVGAVWQHRRGSREQRRANCLDGITEVRRDVAPLIKALDKAGLNVWIWGFPWVGHEQAFVDGMSEVSAGLPVWGWVLDPEEGYKYDRTAASERRCRARSGLLVRKSASSGYELAVSSYGFPRYHRTFPFEEFCLSPDVSTLIPQIYKVRIGWLKFGLEQWRGWGKDKRMVPAFKTFGSITAYQLESALKYFTDQPDVLGLAGWALRSTSEQEAAVIAQAAVRLSHKTQG